MHNMKVGTGVHYLSIPEHPYYQKQYGWKVEDYPNSMKIGRQLSVCQYHQNLLTMI